MKIFLFIVFLLTSTILSAQEKPGRYYSDSGVINRPIAKDPKVIFFKGKYLMYYSVPGLDNKNWSIGIASSNDLIHWQKTGALTPGADYEKNGLCAPGAIVRNNKVELFYQTYGNGKKDAICHAVSDDGINFKRNPTNPIFHPSGEWTCGRAIDAEVVAYKGRYFLYFATRDTAFKTQMLGVAATADTNTSFNRDEWVQLADSSILQPTLPWEKKCIEAPSCTVINDKLYMFYAGGYNNEPQQIGVAVSNDGVQWQRLSDLPFLANGRPGSWNESESGHPDIFKDAANKYYLFFQGNNDRGASWYLSKTAVTFTKNGLVEMVSGK